jgi:hypothetical protein
MQSTSPERSARPDQAVVDWLLGGDPAIRWQVMRDLLGQPEEAVAAERARIGTEGWGARLLALQAPDGHWGGAVFIPNGWTSTFETLLLLRELGLDPSGASAAEAIARVREKCDWGAEFSNSPFFEGETEPCINGRTLAVGAYFGEASDRLLERLLGEQLDDGGWNCEAPPSKRSSFNSTICVLEGLLEYERAKGPTPTVTEARLRGQEYLLERRLLRSLSTGEVINLKWTQASFPTHWHYDILWGLDFLRRAGAAPEPRAAEAIRLIEGKRDAEGRLPLENPHPGVSHFEMEGPAGTPSRWNTLRALRVLEWYHGR